MSARHRRPSEGDCSNPDSPHPALHSSDPGRSCSCRPCSPPLTAPARPICPRKESPRPPEQPNSLPEIPSASKCLSLFGCRCRPFPRSNGFLRRIPKSGLAGDCTPEKRPTKLRVIREGVMSEESRALLIREALPKLSASEIPTYHNRTGLSNLRSLA